MLHVSNLRLPVEADQKTLYQKLAKHLGVSVKDLSQVVLTRQSIDARKKQDVHYVCSVRVAVPNQQAVLKRNLKGVSVWEEAPYTLPPLGRTSSLPPVVVGTGPAGLFAALTLARAGHRPPGPPLQRAVR